MSQVDIIVYEVSCDRCGRRLSGYAIVTDYELPADDELVAEWQCAACPGHMRAMGYSTHKQGVEATVRYPVVATEPGTGMQVRIAWPVKHGTGGMFVLHTQAKSGTVKSFQIRAADAEAW